MFVTEENADWVGKFFQLACAMQVAEAELLADQLGAVAGLEPAFSGHPSSGRRPAPDDMLGIVEMVAADGLQPPRWGPKDFAAAHRILEQISMLSLEGEDGVSAEFPFGPDGKPALLGGPSSLLRADSQSHPSLGSGLLVRLQLPEPLARGGRFMHPVDLNTQEAEAWTGWHLLGSWCDDDGFPAFVCFVPNCLYRPGVLENLCVLFACRARWAAGLAEAE